MPEGWNVVVVSYEGEERRLLEELRELGRFRPSGFRSLLLGEVELAGFLEELRARFIPSLSRVVPVEENFRARPEELLEVLKGRVEKYAGRIGATESFCVRFERRGLKGRISSGELERELGRHLQELLAREGKSARVELEDPDKIVVIQSVGTWFGMGIIDRAMRERYPFVRVK